MNAQDLVVQKYGGSSLESPQRFEAVARRIKRVRNSGKHVVVVVSAMGKTTSELLAMAESIEGSVTSVRAREVDNLLSAGEIISSAMMAIALQSAGLDAISLNSFQAGIITNEVHMAARINSIDTSRILREVDAGRVVVVTGFQGIGPDGDTTTLGRGGSDTTAVALAIALGASRCEIYTNVDGIYTADPNMCPQAVKLKTIPFNEMLELAGLGAKMNPRSIELAAVYNVPIYVASSFNDSEGTLIQKGGGEMAMEIRKVVTGIAVDTSAGRITVTGVKDRPGVAAGLLRPLGGAGIVVGALIQNTSPDTMATDFTFLLAADDLDRAIELLKNQSDVVYGAITSSKDVAKISIVGTGVINEPNYGVTMFGALAAEGINIDMITTSEIGVTCVIARDKVEPAVRALHSAFELESRE